MIRLRDGSTPAHSRPTISRPASGTTRSSSVAGATTTHASGVTPELYAARMARGAPWGAPLVLRAVPTRRSADEVDAALVQALQLAHRDGAAGDDALVVLAPVLLGDRDRDVAVRVGVDALDVGDVPGVRRGEPDDAVGLAGAGRHDHQVPRVRGLGDRAARGGRLVRP